MLLKKVANFISDNMYLFGIGFFIVASYVNIAKKNREQKTAKKILQKTMATKSDEPLTLHPQIDPAKCLGCGACTHVCPEGDILRMINHKAVLVSPTKCVGHGECEAACPFGAIDLVFGTKTRGVDIPRITRNYETNIPGLYIAGELGGMGLIRNAVKQGAAASQHALQDLDRGVSADYDLFIIGAGPAGLSASLAAIAARAKYRTIDQNSFGGTVKNFPRQKIVMSQPADLPIIGKMVFDKNKVSKEELLGYWHDVRKKTGLQVAEKEAFETLEKRDGIFFVKTSKGEFSARKVILAMGVRGSPRRLGLPNEELPKVTYNLIDPQQYHGCAIAIVGGGNSALEAAQRLAAQPLGNRVTLLIHGETMSRANDENRVKVESLQKQGLLQIWYKSQVKEIQAKSLTVEKDGQIKTIPNDYLFVMIGAEMPQKFLMSLGVQIDKKFGQGLEKSGTKRPA